MQTEATMAGKVTGLPFFTLKDMHPQMGDKSITIEEDTPEGRAVIAARIEEYKKEGWRVYMTLTEKKLESKGFFFRKPQEVERKVSYLVHGYNAETNEWILDDRSTAREVPEKRVILPRAEVTRFRPVVGG